MFLVLHDDRNNMPNVIIATLMIESMLYKEGKEELDVSNNLKIVVEDRKIFKTRVENIVDRQLDRINDSSLPKSAVKPAL